MRYLPKMDSSPVNVVRLLAIMEAESITGPAKNLLQFARTLREGGFDPEIELAITTFVRTGRENNLFVESAKAAGLPVYTIPETGRFDRSVVPALRKTVEQFQPDIVQTHAVKSHFLLRSSGLHRRLPWIAFHHGYTWPDLRARLYNELDRWSLRGATQVVTVSQPFREQLAAKGVHSGRIKIVHNAIDGSWGSSRGDPAALRRDLGIASEVPVVLIVGRLSREKDHLTLLRALQRTSGTSLSHLVIVGDGPERANIEEAVRTLGLERVVSLVGQQPSAEPYYRIANIAVLSSLSEGSPNALLEAMAAGVPVVATTVGGIPEIVSEGESALLVPPAQVEPMAAALAKLLANPEIATGLAARARVLVKEKHSPDARARRLCKIYRGILERSPTY